MQALADPDYRALLSGAAERLLSLPQTPLSLLSGLAALQLGAVVYREVRSPGLGKSTSEVYDDLMSELRSRRSGLRGLRPLLAFVASRWKLFGRLYRINLLTLPRVRHRHSAPTMLPDDRRPISPRPPVVSIVVVNRNRRRHLETCLGSLWETAGEVVFEVIVVDNGSADGSAEFLNHAREAGFVHRLILSSENLGNSRGYNLGFTASDPRSRFLMKLDSDIKLLTGGWLDSAVRFLDLNPRVGLVALNQLNHSIVQALAVQRVGDAEVMDFGGWPIGSAMLFPRSVYEQIGHFVEVPGVTYLPDDVNYYSRIVRKGYEAWHLRPLQAYHNFRERGQPSGSSRKQRLEFYRLALSLAREYDRGDRPLELFLQIPESTPPGQPASSV